MLQNGTPFLMIPGPTTIPAEVLRAMHRQAIDIYEGPVIETTESCLQDLKQVFRTRSGEVYIYISNGHGAWDAALANTLARGDKVLILESGHFATSWGESAAAQGLEVEILPGSWREAVDLEALRHRLAADTAGEIKAVMTVQVDTASGVLNDVPGMRRVLDETGHDALFMVDTIASLACVPFEMEDWGVDVVVSAAQKGLMTPPGLAFVAAGPKAHAAEGRADLKTRYTDWAARRGPLNYHRHCGTAPEHLMWALRAALDIILAEGMENVWRRHAVLAGAVRAAAAKWCEGGAMEFNITRPEERADSVSVFLLRDLPAAELKAFLIGNFGVTIGTTIGAIAGKGFRIGHMGHVNAPMVLGTLAAVEAALTTLGVPLGRGGMDAAIAAISGALSDGRNG